MKCLQCGAENEDSAKFCTACGVNLNQEKKSFWKHLFNWKYYIFPLFLGVFVGAGTYAFDSLGYSTADNKVPMLIWIGIIIQTKNFKAPFGKRLLMFFASSFSLVGFMGIIIAITIAVYTAINTDSNKQRKMYINSMMQQNKNLPMMINNKEQILKYTSDNSHSVKLYVKFVKYTKKDILSEYKNVNDFENDMLNSELKASCSVKGVKNILASGLVNWIEYYGKNGELIGTIYLNDKRCKPYYK